MAISLYSLPDFFFSKKYVLSLGKLCPCAEYAFETPFTEKENTVEPLITDTLINEHLQ
jgi:hypothetical protein